MPSIVDSLVKGIFNKATVIFKQQIAPQTYHMRIQSDQLRGYHYTAGDHVRLFVGVDRGTQLDSKVRTYSIWSHDSAQGIADLAMCTHSSGIGAQWIRRAQVGDVIYYMGPKGKLTIDPTAGSHLMIGDPSALSHMYAIRNAVAPGKNAAGITYSSDDKDYYADLDGSRSFHFIRAALDPTGLLIDKVDSLRDQLTGNTTIYLGGDARTCKSLGRYFRENWPDATIRTRGFWMPGKTGMD